MDNSEIDMLNYSWKNNMNLKDKEYYRDDYNGKLLLILFRQQY